METRKIAFLTAIFTIVWFASSCQSYHREESGRAKSDNVDSIQSKANQVVLTEELAGLDILQDYDRDLWGGPDAWSKEQWRWKKTLKWDHHCDYLGEVETFDLQNKLQLVRILCVPGAYQPMSYLYLFDQNTRQGKQLELAADGSTDNPKESFGNIEFDSAKKQLSILTLSRGLGDCGTYQVYQLARLKSFADASFEPAEVRRKNCEDHAGKAFEELPKSLFDYKNWPLIKTD